MHIVLVGADLEENLGVGMIAAVAAEQGHRVDVAPFNDPARCESIARRIVDARPDIVGLSIQFQHRAREFLGLARWLRALGYAGHVTCGGQFPTLAWRELLADHGGVDSVVLHDGEETFVELLLALEQGRSLTEVQGLAIVDSQGAPLRTAGRPLVADLDRLPFPVRYRPHALHAGIPFIPIMGGRGCWGRCSFCSITSFYRDARGHGGGKMLRLRSPDNVAEEMAALTRKAGGRAVFCFHDDNLLLPRPEESLGRIRAIREALDRLGADDVGLIGKCRPDCLTQELARELRRLGVVRLYLGVENASAPGSDHLQRGLQIEGVRQALAACREAGIFVCYNLLLFEPDAVLDDIAENIAFVREHADHPVNFGRAEPYIGTPLQRRLATEDRLSGGYLGHGYRIRDDRTELLFRICAATFRQRNYDADGVHNRYMGVGYVAALLAHFGAPAGLAELASEATALTRSITLQSMGFLEDALQLAQTIDLGQRDRIERETALLALRVAEADRWHHARLDRFFRDARLLGQRPGPDAVRAPGRVARMAQGMALGALIAAGVQGCDGRSVKDPDYMVVDPDAGPLDYMVADPDAGPLDHWVVDPDVQPLDATPVDAGDGMVVDPDAGPLDSSPAAEGQGASDAGGGEQALNQSWRDTAPQDVTRTTDLPLFDPPAVRLVAEREPDGIRVRLAGGPRAISARWEGDGRIEGEAREVRWLPEQETDQIRVGVRSHGGITVAALRALDVSGGDPTAA